MSGKICRRLAVVGILAAGILLLTIGLSGQTGYQPSTKNGEWPYYTADLKGTRYSPLDQINASNFKDLGGRCLFKKNNLGTRCKYNRQGTPCMVNCILYSTSGRRRDLFP